MQLWGAQVENPIPDGGVEPKVSELGDGLQGHDGIERWTVVNDQKYNLPSLALNWC